MLRTAVIVGVFFSIAGLNTAHPDACGDKFLRVGRSMKVRGYSPVHQGSILIYANPDTVRDFREFLARFGHTSAAVGDVRRFAEALATGKYDVAVVPAKELPRLAGELRNAPSKPEILQVFDHAQGRQPHICALHSKSNGYEALAEIDHLLDGRLKRAVVGAASR